MGSLYLCKPGGVILGTMTGLNDNSVSLQKAVGIWQLTFEVNRYQFIDGEYKETSYYNFLSERMELYLDTEDTKARFIISSEPSILYDGVQEVKTVTASSIEYELQDKILRLFDINTGKNISQENLLQDDEGHEYNVDPYTQKVIDYVRVHRDFVGEITALKNQIDNGYLEWNYMETDEGVVKTEMKHFVLQYEDGGLVTAEDDENNLFPRYVSHLLKTYPRLENNILYGIDHRTDSDTYDQEVAVTESYLRIVEDKVKIPVKQFEIQTEEGKDYIIKSSSTSYPSISDSLSKLITFYQTYGHQLSLLDLALEKANAMGWTVGNVPENIGRQKWSFSVNGTNVYAFFTNDCANTMKVVFDFDRLNKKVNIIDVAGEDKEHDTGVFIGFENLVNQIDVQTSSEDGIRTLFRPKGANDLGVEFANFGEDSIINLDYFMHRTDADGEHQFVSDELANKYDDWKDYRDNEEITIDNIPDYEYVLRTKTITKDSTISKTYSSRREAYIDLTKRYNQAMIDIDEFEELLPNDGCSIDYTTFPFDDLVIAWKAYTNALDALLQLYKTDHNVKTFNMDTLEATDPVGNPCKSIKDTMYWADFASYVYTIIPNVENALKIYVATDAEGNFLPESKNEKGEWVAVVGGNKAYNTDAEMVTENMYDEYLYDMSLYGHSELEIKRRVWADAAAQLYFDGFIIDYNDDGTPKTYNTPDENGWARLISDYEIFNMPEITYYNSSSDTPMVGGGHSFYNIVVGYYSKDSSYHIRYSLTNNGNNIAQFESYIRVGEYDAESYSDPPSNIDFVNEYINIAPGQTYNYDKKITLDDYYALFEPSDEGEPVIIPVESRIKLFVSLRPITQDINVKESNGSIVITNEKTKNVSENFTSYEDYITKLNKYLDYVSYEERDNSLTKKHTKGVIQMAAEESAKCTVVLDRLKEFRDTFDVMRKEIATAVKLDNWNFTEKEFGIIYNLITESDYSNENILTTNIDTLADTVDIERDLYEDANKRLFEKSRPQYSFTVDMDNLLAIDEFKNLSSSIQILNFIYLKLGIYDDAFTRLRMIGIEYNPIIKTQDITLTFSNMVYQLDGVSDLESLFAANMGNVSSGGSGSSGSGGGGGTYGTNDADIQISNNMLNALLSNNGYLSNTQMIITKSETAVGQKLKEAEYAINGKAVMNLIMSSNYNGTNDTINNTKGSVLKLDDGTFNFGGGGLKFDGNKLTVTGDIVATNLTLDGNASIDGSIITGVISSDDNKVSIDLNNKTVTFPKFEIDAQGNATFKGSLDGATGTFNDGVFGNCTATNLTINNGKLNIVSTDVVNSNFDYLDSISGNFATVPYINFTNVYNGVTYVTKIAAGYIEVRKTYSPEEGVVENDTTVISPGKIELVNMGTNQGTFIGKGGWSFSDSKNDNNGIDRISVIF